MADDHDISIRALDVNDLEALRTIRILALEMHADSFGEPVETVKSRSEDKWREMLEEKGRNFFGLFDDSTIIGMASLSTWDTDTSGETGLMGEDFIKPKYRGLGYSSYLYEARLNFAVQHGAWKKLIIAHREGLEASRSAIVKHGFTHWKSENVVWPDGIPDYVHLYQMDLCALRRDIDPSENCECHP